MAGSFYRIESAGQDAGRAARMVEEIRQGLTAHPPWLPSKYFYDDRGSQLFEDITALPEYYQTRTEERLLGTIAADVIARVRPAELVELGSGAGRKVRILLNSMKEAGLLQRCVLLDINARFLATSAQALADAYSGLSVRGVLGDFLEDLRMLGPGGGRLAAFFAGTIGNLHPEAVPPFLARVARQLEPGDAFLVGLDLVKDVARLEAAYNDCAGVTAEFNRNILRALNTQFGADFDPAAFAHVAFYDRRHAWIEMRLRARAPQRVRIPAARLDVEFLAGDEIRTEISCKYTRGSFEPLLAGTGLAMDRWYTDPENLFALALLTRTAPAPDPTHA
jgi:L-histidine N-alpha-methyltransferase